MKISALVLSLCVSAAATAAPRYSFADVDVLTQDGRHARFYSDLVKGHTVVINFIFTSCTTVCPIMGTNFARLQKVLGNRPVALLSVSIDPTVDTPARLTAWRARLGGQAGWTLVTGSHYDIDELLKSAGVFTPDRFSHTPVVLVGNDAAGRWERLDGVASPSAIASAVDRVSGNVR